MIRLKVCDHSILCLVKQETKYLNLDYDIRYLHVSLNDGYFSLTLFLDKLPSDFCFEQIHALLIIGMVE